MIIGLKDVDGPEIDEPFSALYNYKHIIGKGGLFRFGTQFDVVTLDGDGNAVKGTDGTKENIRAAAAWNTAGKALTHILICGGTLGQGSCKHWGQCWEADGTLTYDEVFEGDPNWEKCDTMPIDNAEVSPPSEEELSLPSEGETDTGAPVIPEPSADTEE